MTARITTNKEIRKQIKEWQANPYGHNPRHVRELIASYEEELEKRRLDPGRYRRLKRWIAGEISIDEADI